MSLYIFGAFFTRPLTADKEDKMINYLSEMNKAKSLINANSDITNGNKVVTGFNTGIVPTPLRCLYTVIKPLKLEVEKTESETGTTTKCAKFRLGINIHKAEKLDPNELLERFSMILNLLENSGSFDVDSSGFGELERDADTNSIFLPGYITFAYYY